MQVNFNGDEYNINDPDSFGELVTNLRASQHVHGNLYLTCELAPSAEDLANLYTKINSIYPPLIFQISLKNASDEVIYSFERYKFSQTMRAQIARASSDTPSESSDIQVSPHKINMVRDLPIHIPQQQSRVISIAQHQEDPEAEEVLPEVVEEPTEEEEVADNLIEEISDLDIELVNRDNIVDVLSLDCEVKPDVLFEMWDKFVGVYAQVLTDKSRVITDIQKEIILAFINNYTKMQYGVSVKNLPLVVDKSGNILYSVKFKKLAGAERYVLCANSPESDNHNDLTQILGFEYTLPTKASYIEFFGIENTRIIEVFFPISGLTPHVTENEFKKLCKNKPLQDKVKKVVDKFPNVTKTTVYLGFADILVTAGEPGLHLVLNQISAIRPELIEGLLEKRSNYTLFATQSGLDKLANVARFSDAEKVWWSSLVSKCSPNVDFFELYNAFTYFLREFEALHLGSLPDSFPFTDAISLDAKATLTQVLYTLKDIKHPSQLHLLDGMGDYLQVAQHVVQHEDLRVVTADMGLERVTPNPDRGTAYAIQDNAHFKCLLTREPAGLTAEGYANRCKYFYRYIARNGSRHVKKFAYENYVQVVAGINKLSANLLPIEEGVTFYRGSGDAAALPAGVRMGFVYQLNANNEVTSINFIRDGETYSVAANKLSALITKYNLNTGETVAIKSADQALACIQESGIEVSMASIEGDFRELALDVRSDLLYIAATLGTSTRSFEQGSEPNKELLELLAEIRAYADTYSLSIADVTTLILRKGFNNEQCLTISEFSKILGILRRSRSSSATGLEVLESAIDIINCHTESAVAIFANMYAVASKRSLGLGPQDPCRNYVIYNDLIKTIPDPEVQDLFARLLSLCAAETIDNLQLVGDELVALDILKQQTLLAKLAKINPDSSNSYLSQQNLLELIAIANELDASEIESEIQKYLVLQNLDIKFRSSGVVKSSISVASAVIPMVETYNRRQGLIRSILDPAINAYGLLRGCTDVAKAIIDGFNAVNKIITQMNNPALSETELLELFNQADKRLFHLRHDVCKYPKGQALIDYIQSTVTGIKAIEESSRAKVDKYFNSFSLAVFMDEAIEVCIDEKVSGLVTGLLGGDESQLAGYLQSYMQCKGKPIGFGLMQTDINPKTKDQSEQNRLKKDLRLMDGVVLYNEELYFVCQTPEFTVSKIHVKKAQEGAEKTPKELAFDELKVRLSTATLNTRIPVSVDGCRLIKLPPNRDQIKGELTDYLYKLVRGMSISQDAIFSYSGHYYYYSNLEQSVTQIDRAHTQTLLPLFTSSISDREAVTKDEIAAVEACIGRVPNDERSLLTDLGVKTLILPSEIIGEYTERLDWFSEFIAKLEDLKASDIEKYNAYLELFRKMSNYVSSYDLLPLYDVLEQLLDGREGLDSVNALSSSIATVYERVEAKSEATGVKPISLGYLLNSLNELLQIKSDMEEAEVDNLLAKLIPFSLNGTSFPFDVYLANKDSSPGFLNTLLRAADSATSGGGFDLIAEINSLKDKYAERDVEINPLLSVMLVAFTRDATQTELYKSINARLQHESISDHTMQLYIKVLRALASSQDPEEPDTLLTLNDINLILDGLEVDVASLDDICNILFDSPPYPPKQELLAKLQLSPAAFEEYRSRFDLHPYGEQNRVRMNENFKIGRVLDVISGIVNLSNNQPLSIAEQRKLAKDFSYINRIGQGGNLLYPRDEDGNNILVDGKHGINIRTASRKQLKELASKLRDAFKTAEELEDSDEYLSHPNNRLLSLHYITVMRELYYRSTGILPNSTQILTILYALDNPPQHIAEINTAEGKSITTALYSAIMCAKGCTVFSPTSSEILVQQDYHDKHNDRFFEIMGFKSRVISAEGDIDEQHLYGGIHYGTSMAIDAHLSVCQVLGKSLTQREPGAEIHPLACVKDEHDTDLDDLAMRSVSLDDQAEDPELSPTWIISAVNRFVETDSYRQIAQDSESNTEPKDAEQDLRDLKRELFAEAKRKVNKLKAIAQVEAYLPRLEKYLELACKVHQYRLNQDYAVITEDSRGMPLSSYHAAPIQEDTAGPVSSNNFPDGAQPFLHDLLNQQGAYVRQFPVRIEPINIDKKSNRAIAKVFKFIVGLTATSGSHNEISEQSRTLGEHAFKIPPHYVVKRRELTPRAVKGVENRHQAIIDAVKYNVFEDDITPKFVLDILLATIDLYRRTLAFFCSLLKKEYTPVAKQPVLIFVGSIDEAQQLKDKMAKSVEGYEIQLIDGSEPTEDADDNDENIRETSEFKRRKAGKPNVITITIPMFARGVDYDSKHPEGIFGIKAFDSSLRGGVQVVGRIGRKSKPGKFLEIVDTPTGSFRYESVVEACLGLSDAQKKEQIKENEERLDTEKAVKRYYIQESNDLQQVILNHFDLISHKLVASVPKLQHELFKTRHKLLTELDALWEKCLQESEKNEKHSSRYIRRNTDGSLDCSKLDRALSSFERQACELWTTAYTPLLAGLPRDESKLAIGVQIDGLLAENISEEFMYRKMRLQFDRKQAMRVQRVSKERSRRLLAQYIDGSSALLEYDGDFYAHQAEDIKYYHAQNQLKYLFEHYAWLGLTYDECDGDPSVLYNLSMLVDRLLNYPNRIYADHVKLYPVVKECISIYDLVQERVSKVASEDTDSLRNFSERIKYLKVEYSEESFTDKAIKYFKKHLGYIGKALELMSLKNKFFKDTQGHFDDLIAKYYDEEIEILDFYQQLQKYKCLLENRFELFPFASYLFGSHNLIKLIDDTLANLEYLSDFNEDYAISLNNRREIGLCEGYFASYLSDRDLHDLSKRVADDKQEEWRKFIDCFKAIRGHSAVDGLYHNYDLSVIDELLSLAKSKQKTHSFTRLTVRNAAVNSFTDMVNKFMRVSDYDIDPLKMLIKKLEKIRAKMVADNPGVFPTEDRDYLEKKACSIKSKLEIDCISSVKVHYGYEAARGYYDVEINLNPGSDIPEDVNLADFTQVSSVRIEDFAVQAAGRLDQEIADEEEKIKSKGDEKLEIEQQRQTAMGKWFGARAASAFTKRLSEAQGNRVITRQEKIEALEQGISQEEQKLETSRLQRSEIDRHKEEFIKQRYAARPGRELLVRRFNSLEALISFENSLRSESDPRFEMSVSG